MFETTKPEYICITKYNEDLHELMMSNFEVLQQLAYCAFTVHNLTLYECAVVCAEACHKDFDFIANIVSGGHDWEKYRQEGREAIARALHMWDFCERLARAVPYLENEILKLPEVGRAKLILIGIAGISVYEILPRPLPSSH